MMLVRLGFVLLSFATLAHAFEHWEVSAFEKCVFVSDHDHASPDHDSPSHASHNHGCSSHEHSPAVLQAAQPDFPQPTSIASFEVKSIPPPSIARKIDQPPRIS
jgi:hypothetical protein